MALVNKTLTLDITPGAIPEVVKVSEYDINRQYVVTLLDENGTFTIPSGTTAKVEGSIGGNAFSESATVSGNTITFTLTESMTALAGDVWCKIKLTNDSKPIQTCAFILRCDKAGAEADTVIGAPGFQEQINEGVAEYFDNDPPFFELPSGGQSGQALLSDGADGAYWGTVQGGGGSLPAGYAYADSIPANANRNIKYILPDGYIWEWRDSETTVVVPYNANTGIINQVPAVSQTDETLYTENGVLLSEQILWDDSWTEYEKQPTAITISGISQLVKAYNSPIIVYYYKKDGSYLTAMQATQMHSIGAANNNDPIALPITFNLADNNVYPIDNIGHVRVLLGISTSGAITANDVANVVINVPFYDTEQSVIGGSWVNTGTKYTPSEDGDDSELESRVDDLETDVSALQDDVELKDEGKILYAVGDSITYGYGVGGNNFSWVKHVIDRNGYDATNSRNLGESGLGFCTTSTSNHTIQDIVGGTDFSGADIVTVALGLNDWKNSSVTLSDFWTGMEYVFNKIRTDNPYCKLFFILPFNARFLGTFASFYCLGAKGEGNAALCYGNTLQTFINLIKDKLTEATFRAFRIQVIDMTECPAINRHNITEALIDYTHPSAATHVALGKEIARRIMLADGAR